MKNPEVQKILTSLDETLKTPFTVPAASLYTTAQDKARDLGYRIALVKDRFVARPLFRTIMKESGQDPVRWRFGGIDVWRSILSKRHVLFLNAPLTGPELRWPGERIGNLGFRLSNRALDTPIFWRFLGSPYALSSRFPVLSSLPPDVEPINDPSYLTNGEDSPSLAQAM